MLHNRYASMARVHQLRDAAVASVRGIPGVADVMAHERGGGWNGEVVVADDADVEVVREQLAQRLLKLTPQGELLNGNEKACSV